MLLADIAAVSARVAAIPARNAKVAQLAELLRRLSPDEAALAVTWLSGELTQRQIGVGWASLRGVPAPAEQASLTIAEVESRFNLIKAATGTGSQQRRRDLLERLFSNATEPEQVMLRGLLSGDLRQGALGGLMTSAIAKAADVRVEQVRRAAMFSGGQASVARVALTAGSAGLAGFGLRVGTPLSPMLAQTATDPADALARLGGRAAFEWKLDGTRIQVHRDGDEVAVFTRSLDDVTARLPEVAAAVRSLPVTTVVADGEAIALHQDGRPQPFQVTAARLGSHRDVAARQALTPLTPILFDVLHLDGRDLLDLPAADRADALARITTAEQRVARIVTDDVAAAQAFVTATLARGHEGVLAKGLGSAYEAGRRGAGWLKIKPVHTLDLVVLAVERGSGRRASYLSNIHLGARDPAGGFVLLGKTFKGMTDAMLAWQTGRFLELADGPADGWVVRLRPEQVVEIAFDGVQRSSRYPGGVTLRFARVVRYREDKPASEADTIDAVRRFHVE